jgi:hypothetical protein
MNITIIISSSVKPFFECVFISEQVLCSMLPLEHGIVPDLRGRR